MTIEKFRELMGLEEGQYYKFSMLRKRVIDVAVDEIRSFGFDEILGMNFV